MPAIRAVEQVALPHQSVAVEVGNEQRLVQRQRAWLGLSATGTTLFMADSTMPGAMLKKANAARPTNSAVQPNSLRIAHPLERHECIGGHLAVRWVGLARVFGPIPAPNAVQ